MDLKTLNKCTCTAKQNEERFLALIKAISDVIYSVSPDWKTMTALYGRGFLADTDEPNSNWLDKYICPEDRELVLDAIQSSIAEKKTFELEHRVFQVDGSIGWTFSRAVPIFDENGDIKEWFGAASDITKRKRVEQELRESKKHSHNLIKELEGADKNKDQFISVLSHELKNPLAAILAGVQMLDITQDTDLITKSKEVIKRQTDKLCRLVDDLLELTRITQNKINLKRKNINLNETVRNIVGDVILGYEKKGIKFGAKIQAEPIFLNADPVRIAQTIENILTNALKFTQENGTVQLTLKREGNCAVINIKDNGIGINPESLPHLFKPFTQADDTLDRSNGGLGLGLSIVKGIVDLHGGTVSAYSDGLGKGSTFTIRLPIASGPYNL